MSNDTFRVELSNDGASNEYEHESGRNRFDSQQEMIDAMRDPRYRSDRGYEKFVKTCIANSDPRVLGVPGAPAVERKTEAVSSEILHEQAMNMFASPLYKTSPSYRKQVEDFLRGNMSAVDQMYGSSIRKDVGEVTRIEFRGDISGPNRPEKSGNGQSSGSPANR